MRQPPCCLGLGCLGRDRGGAAAALRLPGRHLVALELISRYVPDGLKTFLRLRDHNCRIPYCEAPIRHDDHTIPVAAGGKPPTATPPASAKRHNYTKDLPGWHAHTRAREPDEEGDDGHDHRRPLRRLADGHTHTLTITTPTGHTYTSTSPPLY